MDGDVDGGLMPLYRSPVVPQGTCLPKKLLAPASTEAVGLLRGVSEGLGLGGRLWGPQFCRKASVAHASGSGKRLKKRGT